MPAIRAVVFHFDSARADHRGAEFAEEGSRRKRTGGPRRRLIRLCPPYRLRAFLSELRADAAGDFQSWKSCCDAIPVDSALRSLRFAKRCLDGYA